MARYQWLRLHHEARNDAKLETLPDDQFRVWFRLLCFAGEQPTRGTIAGYRPRVLAAEVARGNVALLNATLATLDELDMISRGEEGGAVAFRAWNQRQYDSPSDAPEQTRERKARSRDVTNGHERVTNGHATQNTDADAETDAEGDHLPPRGDTTSKRIVDDDVAAPASAAAHSVSEQDDPVQIAERVAAGMKWAPGSYDPDDLLAVLRCYPDVDGDELVKEARKSRAQAPQYHKRADLVWLDNWLRRAFPRQQPASAAATVVAPEPDADLARPAPAPDPPLPAVSLAGYREDARTWRAVAAELRSRMSAARFDSVFAGARLLLPPKNAPPDDPDAIATLVLHSRATLEQSDRETRRLSQSFQAAAPHIASLRRVCPAQIVTEEPDDDAADDDDDEAACTSPATDDGLPPAEPAPVIALASHRRAHDDDDDTPEGA